MSATPPHPAEEEARLAALHACDILDTGPEEAFEELVRLAARLTGHPVAFVSLVDRERMWVKAGTGLPAREVPRDHSFCAHAILRPGEPLSVPDATRDPRFRDNPFVTGEPWMRAYLGVPLVDSEGHALGSFCVMDHRPRVHGPEEVETMRVLARAVMANLELRRAARRLRVAARTDGLTGLPNRAAATEALAALLAAGRRVGVVALDLDHLKEANDAHGHAAGDAALTAAAARMRAALRKGDLLARFGGDEFVVLLPDTGREAATAAAERLVAVVSEPLMHGGEPLRMGITAGVAAAPADAASPALLLRLADEALVAAKRKRRGTVGLATPDDVRRLGRQDAVVRFLEAAPAGAVPHLGAHFQPIVSLTTGAPSALEALARCQDPAMGAIAPDELFAAAARLGRAHELSRQVRAEAMAGFAALRRAGLAPPRLAVNLSAAELLCDDVTDVLEAQLEATGLDPRALAVEITEDALLARVAPSITRRLAELRGRGMRIELDDFGTGTSGLAQLLHVPLDAVKLDRSFVRRLGTDGRAERVVEGVAQLAQSLGLDMVAEGVEREGEAQLLRALGCGFGQGWLYAAAMPLPEVQGWLAARRAGAVPLRAARPVGG